MSLKMFQQVKILATKLDDLSWLSGIHMVVEGNQLLQVRI